MLSIEIARDKQIPKRLREVGIFDDGDTGRLDGLLKRIEKWRTKEEIKRYYELVNKKSTNDLDEREIATNITLKPLLERFENEYLNNKHSYSIDQVPVDEMPKNTGYVLTYLKGADIVYGKGVSDVDEIDKMDDGLCNNIVILHETGHLIFHISSWLDNPIKNPPIRPWQEIEASRCAEWILCWMNEKCNHPKVTIPYLKSPDVCHNAIIIVTPGDYESELKRHLKAKGPVTRSDIAKALKSA